MLFRIYKDFNFKSSINLQVLEIPVFYETDDDVDYSGSDPSSYQVSKSDGSMHLENNKMVKH